MPSLFSKRSRSLSTTRPSPQASSSAHLAAAQAFLASKPSQSNLSASAAAAALRSMSPASTSVDQVQTKRMINRQASNSSMANSPRGRSRGAAVQRKTSVGSMTERTFRSPSPGQPQSPSRPIVGAGRGAPPVPAVPASYTDDVPAIPPKSHRRSASMEAPSMARPSGRGQNTNQLNTNNSPAAIAARQSARPQPAIQMRRSDSQDSRNSYNFSYPRGSRPISPPPRSPIGSSEALPYVSPTNGITSAETARIQYELQQAANKPVKKKKQKVDPSIVEGSHLHSGTMGTKPVVTPLEPLPADYEPPSTAQAVKKPKKKAALTGQSSHFPDHQDSSIIGATANDDIDDGGQAIKRTQRAAGALAKHPSVVREDWEGEQEDQGSSLVGSSTAEPSSVLASNVNDPQQPKKSIPEANMSRKIEDPSNVSKAPTSIHASVTTSSPESNSRLAPVKKDVQAGRGVSISPSRSTRFSDRLASDLASGRKHEPLGRSISPAKSALKHVGGSEHSPIDSRFPGRRGSSVTPSETSDTSDGVTSRKKSTRVSFDASTDNKDPATEANSSQEYNKRQWSGTGKGKSTNLDPIAADDELEEGMKPRPVLPSFGSVRRGDRSTSPNARTDASNAVGPSRDYTASSSETSSIAEPPTMNTSISSDHALGGLLYKQSLNSSVAGSSSKQSEQQQTKPKHLESPGHASDTDSVYSDDGHQSFRAAQSASQRLDQSIGNDAYASIYRDEIPVIAVQPATPGLDESQKGEEWAAEVPGGFPSSGGPSASSSQGDDLNTTPTTPMKTTAGLGLGRSTQEYSTPARDSPNNGSTQQLMTITEEDSDENSVYSDAAEDLSDLEGDGFGSINAIIESPMVVSPPQRSSVVAESPLAAVSQRRPAEPTRATSWEDTQAHWSTLAQLSRNGQQTPSKTPVVQTDTSKRQVEVASQAQKPTPSTQQPTSGRIAKPTTGAVSASQPNVQAAAPRAQNLSSASAVVATKTSKAKQQSHLRSSMRGAPEPVVAPTQQRPASYAGPSTESRVALQKKYVSPAPATKPTAAAPAPKGLTRRFSNDSDSDSSFRKARRNRKSTDGQYTMKRSMRGAPPQAERSSLPGGRGGVRSLSPPVDRRTRSPMGMKTMRTSMRGSADRPVPTLRPQVEEKRSSSLFSRNRAAKSPTRPITATAIVPSKLKSRIGDSDDEDEERPTQFKSRFADSSDEDEPKTFRPVRGIPKRKDEGDSTDLDDSSDDQGRKSKTTAPKKLTIVPPAASQEVISPPLSPTTAKKRGLWSRLRGKKREGEEPEPMAAQTIAERQGIKEDIEENKKERNSAKQLGFDSAAERDAMIEQTRLKLEAAKERAQSPAPRPTSPPGGKLQRRVTPQRVFSDSWAPPKLPMVEDDRPQTSSGIEEAGRPGIGSRQATTEKMNGDGAVYGKSGKKKKFGFLRKAFGLND